MLIKISYFLICLVVFGVTLAPSGCSVNPAYAQGVVKASGTWDIISPMSRDVAPAFTQQNGTHVEFQYSASSFAQLKAGKIDAVVMGRDPTPEELQGLTDNVIAYDAVCIIIDSNSYQGGQYPVSGNPIRKASGFTNLTMSDLKAIFSYYLLPFGQRWLWRDYYTYKPIVDLDHASVSSASAWTPDAKAVYCRLDLSPGKYDTQTLLLQKLGLDESELDKAVNYSYSDENLNAEEEILAVEYQGDSPNRPGSADFPYKLQFASRRVIPVAKQNVFINVVSVDGIDPMQDVQSIYDGTYPFSRKIHILTRKYCSAATTQFVNYLLSPAGQAVLTKANYLPLIQTP